MGLNPFSNRPVDTLGKEGPLQTVNMSRKTDKCSEVVGDIVERAVVIQCKSPQDRRHVTESSTSSRIGSLAKLKVADWSEATRPSSRGTILVPVSRELYRG